MNTATPHKHPADGFLKTWRRQPLRQDFQNPIQILVYYIAITMVLALLLVMFRINSASAQDVQDEAPTATINTVTAPSSGAATAEAVPEPSSGNAEQLPPSTSFADVVDDPSSIDLSDVPLQQKQKVMLQTLDKITARVSTITLPVGQTYAYGTLFIKTQACLASQPEEIPEAAAFLQIWQLDEKGDSEWVFSGWMYASSPALSAMDHPVYDIWVLGCGE